MNSMSSYNSTPVRSVPTNLSSPRQGNYLQTYPEQPAVAAGSYTSMYRTTPNKAATQHNSHRTHPMNADVRDSMEFLSKYCRGERPTTTTPITSTHGSSVAAAGVTSQFPTATSLGYSGNDNTLSDLQPQATALDHQPGTFSAGGASRPSWSTGRGASSMGQGPLLSSHLTPSSAGPSWRDSSRQRQRVTETSSSVTPGTKQPALMTPYHQQSPVLTRDPIQVGGANQNHNRLDLVGGRLPTASSDSEVKKLVVTPQQSVLATQPPLLMNDAWIPSPSGINTVNSHNHYHPALGDPAIVREYQKYPGQQRTLLYIAMYLKNHFGSPDEGTKGLDTLRSTDLTEILECYQRALDPLLNDIRGDLPEVSQPKQTDGGHGVATTEEKTEDNVSNAASEDVSTGKCEEHPVQVESTEYPGTSFANVPTGLRPTGTSGPKLPNHSDDTAGHANENTTKPSDMAQETPEAKNTHRNNSMTKSSPLATPVIRRSMAQNMKLMRKGGYLIKFGRNGAPQRRFFVVKDEMAEIESGEYVEVPHMMWAADVKVKASGKFPFFHLHGLDHGPVNKNFKKNKEGHVINDRRECVPAEWCFSLELTTRTVDLCATNQEDFDLWYGGMAAVLLKNKEHAGMTS